MPQMLEFSDMPFPEAPTSLPLDHLNEAQRRAVETTEGPLLVLAGAGTGKTRVLTTRIANLLHRNLALPGQILAVTFTNKASREMQTRVDEMMAGYAPGMWMGTFHSICVRILRRHGEKVGLKQDFIIIDTDDQIRLLKTILQEHNIDEKRFTPKVLSILIQRLKDRALTPERVGAAELPDFAGGKLLELYQAYQSRLKLLGVVDFGDLLLHVITLFTSYDEVLQEYQRRFRYILVDEYQDTNVAQYLWLRLLAQTHKNICCVGDDDQSIYGWRGAEVGNILKFEQDFPGAETVRLEQNYRSTQDILTAASGLISFNKGRLGKTLWTDKESSEKIKLVSLWDEKAEANYIAEEIEAIERTFYSPPEGESKSHGPQVRGDSVGGKHAERPPTNRSLPSEVLSSAPPPGGSLSDIAILVRAGFQTRAFEECFLNRGIAYRVVGGMRFYERLEIRDAIAYMRVTMQPDDDLAFTRIINTPKRGIGNSTLDIIRDRARADNTSMTTATLALLQEGGFKPRIAATLDHLMQSFSRWRSLLDSESHRDVVDRMLQESGYIQMWKNEKSVEAEGRVENLKELLPALEEFESLRHFLEHISLVMDTDDTTETEMVQIITMHSAKGLEFKTVFLAGWEEGLFPSQRSLDELGTEGLEEERRLAYVGMTRAKENLTISFASSRRIYGQWQSSIPSRFIDEIPKEHVVTINATGPGYNPGGKNPESRRQHSGFVPGRNQEGRAGNRASPQPGNSRSSIAKEDSPKQGQFIINDRIFHIKFGYGRVRAVNGKHLTIAFDKAGTKMILSDFVKKAE